MKVYAFCLPAVKFAAGKSTVVMLAVGVLTTFLLSSCSLGVGGSDVPSPVPAVSPTSIGMAPIAPQEGAPGAKVRDQVVVPAGTRLLEKPVVKEKDGVTGWYVNFVLDENTSLPSVVSDVASQFQRSGFRISTPASLPEGGAEVTAQKSADPADQNSIDPNSLGIASSQATITSIPAKDESPAFVRVVVTKFG